MAKMLIGGEPVDSVSKDTYEVRNPATGAVVDSAPIGNEKDVQQAIQAARTRAYNRCDRAPNSGPKLAISNREPRSSPRATRVPKATVNKAVLRTKRATSC